MRTDAIFKRAYNRVLADIGAPGATLGSEHDLAKRYAVSRTTVRKVLEALVSAGLVQTDGTTRKILRQVQAEDYFPTNQTDLAREIVEKGFMQLVQSRVIRPGQQISTMELARRLPVSPSVIREYLGGFSRFGLIERHASGSWTFRGFDDEFVRELSDVRELFELKAVEIFGDLPLDHPAWQRLSELEAKHIMLLEKIDDRFEEFPDLDHAFHGLIHSVLHNRFVDDFDTVRTFIFHYHYQWSRQDERERAETAIREHFSYIRALYSRDRIAIRAAAQSHLRTARLGLLASISGNRR